MFAVVFGRVLEGYDIVEKVQSIQVNGQAKPLQPITIADCGLLS